MMKISIYNKATLEKQLAQEWNSISVEVCQKRLILNSDTFSFLSFILAILLYNMSKDCEM